MRSLLLKTTCFVLCVCVKPIIVQGQVNSTLSGTIQKTESSDYKPLSALKNSKADSLTSIHLFAKKDTSQKITPQVSNKLKTQFGFLKSKLTIHKPESLNLKKSFSDNTHTSGTISLGYHYGVIPFMVNNKIPTGFFSTEGNVGFEVLKLPFTGSFYYADVKTVIGLNNYFRVSFDANKYKEQFKNRAYSKAQAAKSELTKLYSSRQELEQKLLYLKSAPKVSNLDPQVNQYDKLPANPLQDKFGKPSFTDSINSYKKEIPKLSTDTLAKLKGGSEDYKIDTIKAKPMISDSLSSLSSFQKADSTEQKIKEYQERAKQINEQIKEAEQTIKLLEHPETALDAYKSKNKIINFFSYVNKLDVGLCYPNYSTFLLNGAAIKGINMELQKENIFFALTIGKTINNFLFSNDIIQNKLQNARNLYNFFDFNNVKSGRKIAAVKFGFGKKEETHLHTGVLYGIGQSSYFYPVDFINIPPTKEKNYVFELDGKFIINSNNSVDAVYGKSSIEQEGINYTNIERGFMGIFNSQNRSNAVLVRFNTIVPMTRTKIILTSRYIDPFFKSYGVGFIRSDNFRYEIKLEQALTRKLKVSGFYRKEEDNLLNLYQVKTTLQTIGSNITFRASRQLTLRLTYNPVLQRVRSTDNSVHFDNRNYISNVIVTWTPLKKVNSTFNGVFNYYRLYDGTRNNVYSNYSITNVTIVGIFKSEMTANAFYSNSDTINNNTLLLTEDISYLSKKNWSVTLGIKLADNSIFKNQIGYRLKINLPFTQHLSFEVSAEKIVIGDFYNSNYFIGQLNKFPYYCYSKLIINW